MIPAERRDAERGRGSAELTPKPVPREGDGRPESAETDPPTTPEIGSRPPTSSEQPTDSDLEVGGAAPGGPVSGEEAATVKIQAVFRGNQARK